MSAELQTGVAAMTDPVPPEAYEAAVLAAGDWYEHHAPAICEHLSGMLDTPDLCWACRTEGEVHAAVDAVWPLAVAEGRKLEQEACVEYDRGYSDGYEAAATEGGDGG